MKKEDCLKWAESLINGKYKKLTGKLGNGDKDREPTSCCCLGVLQEVFKPNNYKEGRLEEMAEEALVAGIINDQDPTIFGVYASLLNDGENFEAGPLGIGVDGLTHEQIGILLLLAIETGEYKNI